MSALNKKKPISNEFGGEYYPPDKTTAEVIAELDEYLEPLRKEDHRIITEETVRILFPFLK
ncbi:MAG: hypothetical protein GQ535_05450 [Rhodobacteraceae bacterium]|nr:hypothetical protein [Paracoccaceae bacterium]